MGRTHFTAVTTAPREDRAGRAIALMLSAYLCFTCVDVCAKWMVRAGVPPLEVVFIRYFGHMVFAAAIFIPTLGASFLRAKAPKLQIARAVVLLLSTVCNFIAVRYLPLSLTSAIAFTAPLWVCVLSIPLLGETVGRRRWAAVLLGFCGVLIATRPWSAQAHPAALLSVCAALMTALYVIATRKLAGVDSAATQQFWSAALATLCVAPFAFGGWAWPSSPSVWFAMLAIGVIAMTGHQMLTIAHRFAPASTLAPFVYSQIFTMNAASWLVFDQPPTIWVGVGAAVILGSGLYIWLRERHLARREAQGRTP